MSVVHDGLLVIVDNTCCLCLSLKPSHRLEVPKSLVGFAVVAEYRLGFGVIVDRDGKEDGIAVPDRIKGGKIFEYGLDVTQSDEVERHI